MVENLRISSHQTNLSQISGNESLSIHFHSEIKILCMGSILLCAFSLSMIKSQSSKQASSIWIFIPWQMDSKDLCQQTIFEFSRLDWIQHEMEAKAGKSFQTQINLAALASISCQIQSNRQNTKLLYICKLHNNIISLHLNPSSISELNN